MLSQSGDFLFFKDSMAFNTSFWSIRYKYMILPNLPICLFLSLQRSFCHYKQGTVYNNVQKAIKSANNDVTMQPSDTSWRRPNDWDCSHFNCKRWEVNFIEYFGGYSLRFELFDSVIVTFYLSVFYFLVNIYSFIFWLIRNVKQRISKTKHDFLFVFNITVDLHSLCNFASYF